MKKIEQTSKGSQKQQNNEGFYWEFNPDGSVRDKSISDYSELLQAAYKAITSTGLYLNQ